MITFLEAPFNLVQGDEITGKVIASNNRGESIESSINAVAPLVEIKPH